MFTQRRNLWYILTVLFLASCGTEDDSGTSSTTTYSSLWESSFSGCGLNCHEPNAADGTENGPNMSSKNEFYTNLVGKNIANFPTWLKNSNCDNVNFITPGSAARSSLPSSLIESSSDALAAADNCTTAFNIHVVNQVTVSDESGLIDWINAGAANN